WKLFLAAFDAALRMCRRPSRSARHNRRTHPFRAHMHGPSSPAKPAHAQSHPATSEDALVAISFRNYYPDTARLFPELVARRVPAISITDSLLSPIVEGDGCVRDPGHAAAGVAPIGRADVPCSGPRHRPRSRGRLNGFG